jgi:hypothetical protein
MIGYDSNYNYILLNTIAEIFAYLKGPGANDILNRQRNLGPEVLCEIPASHSKSMAKLIYNAVL